MTSFVENPATGIITVTADGPNDFIELVPSTGVVTGAPDGPTQFIELNPGTGIVTAVSLGPTTGDGTMNFSHTPAIDTGLLALLEDI